MLQKITSVKQHKNISGISIEETFRCFNRFLEGEPTNNNGYFSRLKE
jgi:hypothetical protein